MKRSLSDENFSKRPKNIESDLANSPDQSATSRLTALLSKSIPKADSSMPPSMFCLTWFQDIAQTVCNELLLCIDEKRKFRIVEVEMYLKAETHNDTFAHGDEIQLNTCGQWYFHRQNGKSYKGGTYKGLDITFGVAGQVYGGILIRAIQNMEDDKEYIEGPCKVVDTILKAANRRTIVNLVEAPKFSLDVTNSNGCLRLVDVSSFKDIQNSKLMQQHRVLVSSPRVGLTLKRTDDFKPFFIMKPYRFHCLPHKMSKYKNLAILSHLQQSGAEISEICNLFNATQNQVEKLVEACEVARQGKANMTSFIGQELKADALVKLYGVSTRR